MGLLKSLIGQPSLAETVEIELDDVDPVEARYASAQAAIDLAIRQRTAPEVEADRRNALIADRRMTEVPVPPQNVSERRHAPPDRRKSPQGFGRRTRTTG